MARSMRPYKPNAPIHTQCALDTIHAPISHAMHPFLHPMQCGPWGTINRKSGEEAQKRSLTLRDSSCRSIELTLWGKHATELGAQVESVSASQ